jgi:ribosomal protein S18 acetylase RimI-like enzyme
MGDALIIDPARAEDALAMARLWRETFSGKFAHVFGEAAGEVLEEWLPRDPAAYARTSVARLDGAVVGYIQLETADVPGSRMSFRERNRRITASVRPLFAACRRRFGVVRTVICMVRLGLMDWEPVREGCLHIKMLGVDPAYRGRGIAGRLLDFAESEARSRGLKRLTLGVVSENSGAIRLYERHGFLRGPKQSKAVLRWASGSTAFHEMAKELK